MRTSPASLALIALILLSLFIPSGTALSVENFEVHMMGEKPVTDAEGRYRIVAGIWHQTDVYLDSPADSIDIQMSCGDFSEHNFTNFYHWRYSDAGWSDVAYGVYIQKDRCERTGTLYSFFIGVDGKVNYGLWNLTVSADGSEIYSTQIDVVRPRRGISVSGEFIFRTEPFTPGILNSDDHLIIRNGGNIPLYYNITFPSFSDRINITGKKDIIHVNGDATHYLTFTVGSWSPRIIKITGRITAGGMYRIPTNTTAALIPQVGATFPVTVYIGHFGYEIIEKDGFTLQRKREISLDYNSEAELRIFLTGNGTANIDIKGENCAVEEVVYDGNRIKLPFSLSLSQEHEENISIRIKADVPDVTAKVLYIIEYKGNESSYFTDVKVGPAPPPEPVPHPQPDKTIAAAFIVGAASLATAYIVLGQKKAARAEKGGKNEKRRKKSDKKSENSRRKGGRRR